MEINNSNPLLILRFTQFRKYDFIEQHKAIIGEKGAVWMLKKGRGIPYRSLRKICENGGGMILKAPKITGGKYYFAHFSAYYNGIPQNEFDYPTYYSEIIDEYVNNPLEGTWIKIDYITEMLPSVVENLYLTSNNSKVSEVIGKTRTSVMYAYTKEDFII